MENSETSNVKTQNGDGSTQTVAGVEGGEGKSGVSGGRGGGGAGREGGSGRELEEKGGGEGSGVGSGGGSGGKNATKGIGSSGIRPRMGSGKESEGRPLSPKDAVNNDENEDEGAGGID